MRRVHTYLKFQFVSTMEDIAKYQKLGPYRNGYHFIIIYSSDLFYPLIILYKGHEP